jgi:hypothetical protein
LGEAAGRLSKTAENLVNMQLVECITPEQAAKELCCESVKAFEKIAPSTKSG